MVLSNLWTSLLGAPQIVNLPSTLNEFKNLLNTHKQLIPDELQKISLISIWEIIFKKLNH